jgi:hypothetical protein
VKSHADDDGLHELRRRLAERAATTETELPALEAQLRTFKVEISNLTNAIATGAAAPQAVIRAISEREATATDLEGRIRVLRAAPGVIGLEVRRMEREALARLNDFQGLLERNRDGARKVLDAVLETPLRFTP